MRNLPRCDHGLHRRYGLPLSEAAGCSAPAFPPKAQKSTGSPRSRCFFPPQVSLRSAVVHSGLGKRLGSSPRLESNCTDARRTVG